MKHIDRKKYAADGILLLVALLWGSGFIAQKNAADEMSALCFNGIRYSIGAVFIFFLAKCRLPFRDANGKTALLAGLVLTAAAALQQIGFADTSITNTSFITATYIVFVPFLSGLIFHKKVSRSCYIAALLILVGLFLLSTAGKGLDHITRGDVIVFAGSIFWALHIIVVEKGTSEGDPVRFSAGQFLVSGVLQLLLWLTIGKHDTTGLANNTFGVLYSGIIVLGLAFTLQAIGQKYTGGAVASIILGLESVFGTLCGVIFYHETLEPLQIAGAVLIFAAVLLAVREG